MQATIGPFPGDIAKKISVPLTHFMLAIQQLAARKKTAGDFCRSPHGNAIDSRSVIFPV